jgi:uncharacterized membrane protein
MRHAFAAVVLFFASLAVFAQTETEQCSFDNFRVPVPNVYDTTVNGINNNGTIVGGYDVPMKYQGYWVTVGHGYMLSNNGQLTHIDVPGRAQTQPAALNDKNEVVGDSWPGYSGPPEGFLLNASGYQTLNFPGYYDIFPTGITNQDHIVGEMTTTQGNQTEGFLYANNQLQEIFFPGSEWSYAVSTNQAGDIIGNYSDVNDVFNGFLLSNGTYTTLDYPGAYETFLWAINDNGVVIGSYQITAASDDIFFTWKAGEFEELPADGSYDCQGQRCPNFTTFLTLNDSGYFGGYYQVFGPGYAVGFVASCK